MLAILALSAALLRPAAPAPPDTTREFKGYANLPFAWGTMLLRKNKVVRAFLPLASLRGLEMGVPYYPEVPETGPLPKPKFVAALTVQWLRIGARYWETMGGSRQEPGPLAARVQAGPGVQQLRGRPGRGAGCRGGWGAFARLAGRLALAPALAAWPAPAEPGRRPRNNKGKPVRYRTQNWAGIGEKPGPTPKLLVYGEGELLLSGDFAAWGQYPTLRHRIALFSNPFSTPVL